MNHKGICKHLAANDDEYIFLSAVCDKMLACHRQNRMTATKFLDTRTLFLTKQLLENMGCDDYRFEGGVAEAERVVCVFLPDYPVEEDVVKLVRVQKAEQDTLTHRDYLGSLMGLGIKRECIGDILVHGLGADIAVLAEFADFIMQELSQVGRKSVSTELIQKEDVIQSTDDFQIIKITVPSLRMDAVAGGIFKLSRSNSAGAIRQGKLLHNGAEVQKAEKSVNVGDKITLRGKGKAEILQITGKTKKDRIGLEVKVLGKR